eukprot:TRINITY_DN10455_c0_g1_i2.p1 TRINITY_DN10455_c0_g1~~TRINITY_DN10455_c0_g1_i2.p1  ORF type:complete len:212 (-),score=55.76 TRINITY_DN10455_c0_g1_i2:486-1121(-)
MAKIHNITAGFRHPDSHLRKTVTVQKALAHMRKRLPAFTADVNPTLGAILHELTETRLAKLLHLDDAETNVLPKGMIHGDMHDMNVLFDDQDQISAVLDWDDASYGSLLIDIALGVISWGILESEGQFKFELAREFLRGYNTARVMPSLEWTQLLDHMLVITMFHIQFLLKEEYRCADETVSWMGMAVPALHMLCSEDQESVLNQLRSATT